MKCNVTVQEWKNVDGKPQWYMTIDNGISKYRMSVGEKTFTEMLRMEVEKTPIADNDMVSPAKKVVITK